MPSVYIAAIFLSQNYDPIRWLVAVAPSVNFVTIIKMRQRTLPETSQCAHSTSADRTARWTTAVLRHTVDLKLRPHVCPWKGREMEGKYVHLTPLFTGWGCEPFKTFFVIYRLPDDWCINYIHETMVAQLIWAWTFSTIMCFDITATSPGPDVSRVQLIWIQFI